MLFSPSEISASTEYVPASSSEILFGLNFRMLVTEFSLSSQVLQWSKKLESSELVESSKSKVYMSKTSANT